MAAIPKRRPIRVLHLRDSPWVDGPGRTMIESGRRFDGTRIEYHIGAFVERERRSHEMINAAELCGISAHAIYDRGGIDWSAIESIKALVDRFEIQILHSSDARSRLYGTLVRAARPQVFLVTTVHGWIANSWRRRMLRLLDKSILRYHDHVIFVSEATRSLVPSWWLPYKRSTVVHNALVQRRFVKATQVITRQCASNPEAMAILNVGRLSPEKGQEVLLRAVKNLESEWPLLRVRLAGIGPEESRLRSLVAELGLQARVEFLGYVEDMLHVYQASSLVVQSSLTEGLPNVILEAAHLEVPIIATDVGGTREVLRDRRDGWLIKPGSVEALTDAMRTFLARPLLFKEMAQSARKRVEELFSFEARIERITQLYERLAASG